MLGTILRVAVFLSLGTIALIGAFAGDFNHLGVDLLAAVLILNVGEAA
jgi:hypothetical protein